MKPLLEKTDNVLASWGLSRGSATQHVKPGEAGGLKLDSAEPEASNSVTSVVTPLLEKTDSVLASWGLTNSASSDNVNAVQVTCCKWHCIHGSSLGVVLTSQKLTYINVA